MAIAIVQSLPVYNIGGGINASKAFPSNVTAGNLILAIGRWPSNTGVVSGCDDGALGNTYFDALASPGPARNSGLPQGIFIWYAKNILGGACTVQMTSNVSGTNNGINLYEISGLDTSSPLDKAQIISNGSGTACDAGTLTNAQADEIIIVAGSTNGGKPTNNTGWIDSSPGGNSNWYDGDMYRIVSSITGYSTLMGGGSGNFAAAAVSFKGAGGGGGGPTLAIKDIIGRGMIPRRR